MSRLCRLISLVVFMSSSAFGVVDRVRAQGLPDGPPRALLIPHVIWPVSEPVPEGGFVEALIVVGRDGLAQLEECAASDAVCDGLRAALMEASFEPARVDGKVIPSRVRVRFAVIASETAPAPVPPAVEPAPALDDAGSDYGAVAAVERTRPTARALELAEMREVASLRARRPCVHSNQACMASSSCA